jgi:APA family basic amino acid/polyamine antiporter
VALSLLLVSTISAMALAGPRVIETMAEDLPGLRFLGARTHRGAPLRAVLLLWLIAAGLILTDAFAAVLGFAGFTLILFSLLTVLGVVRLRRREPRLPRPFRVPWYPLPPLIFALLALLSLTVVAVDQPLPVLSGLALLGLLWLALGRRRPAAARWRPPPAA